MTITDEDRAEAKRLALLPKKTQRQAVAIIGSPADDPNVPQEDREEARRRRETLTVLLKLDKSPSQ